MIVVGFELVDVDEGYCEWFGVVQVVLLFVIQCFVEVVVVGDVGEVIGEVE